MRIGKSTGPLIRAAAAILMAMPLLCRSGDRADRRAPTSTPPGFSLNCPGF